MHQITDCWHSPPWYRLTPDMRVGHALHPLIVQGEQPVHLQLERAPPGGGGRVGTQWKSTYVAWEDLMCNPLHLQLRVLKLKVR